MEMLELRHTQPALRNTQVPLAVPVAVPVPPQLQPNPVESRSNLKKIVLHRQVVLENSTTRQPNPLEIVHRGRAPAPHDPTIPEREAPRRSRLQPAANIMHGGRYPTLKALLLLSAKSLDVLDCSQLHMILRQLHNKNQISNHQLKLQTSGQDVIEPDNQFTKQHIERLEAQFSQRVVVRVAEEIRILREHRRHRRQANRHRHAPYPGEWPSEPTHPDSDNVSGTSQLSIEVSGYSHDLRSSLASSELYSSRPAHDTSRPAHNTSRRVSRRHNGGVPRSTRTRVDTHARHNERANRLETVSLQRRILDGLMLTLNYGANGIFNTLSNRVWRLIRD